MDDMDGMDDMDVMDGMDGISMYQLGFEVNICYVKVNIQLGLEVNICYVKVNICLVKVMRGRRLRADCSLQGK